MNKFNLIGAAVIFGIGVITTPSAEAGFVVSVQSGVGLITLCADNAVCDLNGAFGVINTQFVGIGGYDFVIEISQTYPALGSPGLPILRMTSVGNTNLSGASNTTPLTLRSTQTGFTLIGPTTFDLGSTINFPALPDSSAPNATAAFSYFLDNGNAEFGLTSLLGGVTFIYTDPLAQAQADNRLVAGSPDGSFSLTTQLVLNGVDPDRGLSATSAITALQVPEPTSLALVGAALFGIGVAQRRRNRA